MSHIVQLQEFFRSFKKYFLLITHNCHQVQNLAHALNDVDSFIDDVQLVIQILCNVPRPVVVS